MKPWNQVLDLRHDIKTGTLAASEFAADLHAVMENRESAGVYRYADGFFKLTHPTGAMKELAATVAARLRGESHKAVRQLALTYGGGKTHALITLYHLFHDPNTLPRDVLAVGEFLAATGKLVGQARIAAFLGDKTDVLKGLEVASPDGERRRLQYPWTVLAWQLAGEAGLAAIGQDGSQERIEPPAQPLCAALLEAVQGPVLILMDETLMYARAKTRQDPKWRDRIREFLQNFTDAVDATPRCAMVVSLLSTSLDDYDAEGQRLESDLKTVVERKSGDAPAPPVEEHDIAEVLRRRLFDLGSGQDRSAWKPLVQEAVEQLAKFDHTAAGDKAGEIDRFLASYPFHPDLMAALYSKWTQLPRFQRTRGVLRTFALALRDAYGRDLSPIVTPGIFLNAPGATSLGVALGELADVATDQGTEAPPIQWKPILERELGFARSIQGHYSPRSFQHRELEAAVVSTFLHSQQGRTARTGDLTRFAGPTCGSAIEWKQALGDWTERSWFLSDELFKSPAPGQIEAPLPDEWRLGPDPNLKQIHHGHVERLSRDPGKVDQLVLESVRATKSLLNGVAAAGAKGSNIPEQGHRPENFPADDGELQFAVLGLEAKTQAGSVPDIARQIFELNGSKFNHRVYRNALILLAPEKAGLLEIQEKSLEAAAWTATLAQLREEKEKLPKHDVAGRAAKDKQIARAETSEKAADAAVPSAVARAYRIAIAQDRKGEIVAVGLPPDANGAWEAAKKVPELRLKTEHLNPFELTKHSPHQLWGPEERSKSVKDLLLAFAQFSHLPKVVGSRGLYETLQQAALGGLLVIRAERPNGEVRTYWRENVPADILKSAEVVLPEFAELTHLDQGHLAPDRLVGLYKGGATTIGALVAYFAGGREVRLSEDDDLGDTAFVPKADPDLVRRAAAECVKAGMRWALGEGVNVCGEETEPTVLADAVAFLPRPAVPNHLDLTPGKLASAWTDDRTTVGRLVASYRDAEGRALPWGVLRTAIKTLVGMAGQAKLADGAPWSDDWSVAERREIEMGHTSGPHVPRASADLDPSQLKAVAGALDAMEAAANAAGAIIKYELRLEVTGAASDDLVARLNAALKDAGLTLE